MAQSSRPASTGVRQETDAERQAREDQERQRQAAAEEEQTRRDAEAATAHLPKAGEAAINPMTPAEALEALEDKNTVLMNFPAPVTLTLPGYVTIQFPAGVQEVPASLAEDEYLLACGATVMTKREAAAAAKAE